MKHTISGRVSTWTLFGNSRKFGILTVPFEVACDIFKSSLYNGKTGRGEQREIHEPHSRKLQREIKNGTYTPTPVSVGTYKPHREAMHVDGDVFQLEVDSANPLPLTDGSHRFDSLASILESLTERLKTVKSETEKTVLEEQIEQVYRLPICATIYLDGDPQVDFCNLQLGRPVDTSHLMTMRIRRNMGSTPEMATAFEIVKALASADAGPYVGQVRFDSRGKMPLPISTLCTKGSSDLSTSLVGLARVASQLKPAEIAEVVGKLYSRLKTDCPEALEYGKVLTPIGEGGTKGSSTMLVGVTICLLHDALLRGSVNQCRYEDAIQAVQASLDKRVVRSFTAGEKRVMMGDFANVFFASQELEKHEGVPVSLLSILSPGCYGCSPMPKLSTSKIPDVVDKPSETKPVVLIQGKETVTSPTKSKKSKSKKVAAPSSKSEKAVPVEVKTTNPPSPKNPWDAVQMV